MFKNTSGLNKKKLFFFYFFIFNSKKIISELSSIYLKFKLIKLEFHAQFSSPEFT
jgi:hypothetical protein